MDVQIDAGLLGDGDELADRVACAAVADVAGHRLRIFQPGDVDRPGDRQQVFRPQQSSSLDHLDGQLHALFPPRRIVVR